YDVLADSVIWLANPTYLNWPAVAPLNAIETELLDTSVPLLALTSFSVCVPLLPLTTYLPKAVTFSGLAPTVNFMPSQPLKSLRKVPSVAPVINAGCEPPALTVMLIELEVVTAPSLSVALAVTV